MTIAYTPEILDPLVSRVFTIESIDQGNSRSGYIAKYTGCLRREDSAAAYDELSESLKPHDITPLFRKDAHRHVIILIQGLPKPRPSNPWVNVLLFVLTLGSVLLTGALMSYNGPPPTSQSDVFRQLFANLWSGWPFAVSMLGILTAHEFGHYLVGRYHRAQVSLPYFIPLPFTQLGTMGAFINMKEPPRNRRVLLDIGIAGPLAGLVVAIPVLILGLSLSDLSPLPTSRVGGIGLQLEGNSILYLMTKFAVFRELLPHPASYGDLSPVLYWIRYFFTGQPIPFGGVDVSLHPVAWAGWAGILVTALNLIPAGQLDGGHMMYVLVGSRRAKRILPFILVALVLLGFVWNGWWLWAVIIFVLGRVYAEPLDQITPLNPQRKAIAILALIIFLLVFTPVPLTIIS
jgi:membrane-associated protease RseP (regulator of RpoE activity)